MHILLEVAVTSVNVPMQIEKMSASYSWEPDEGGVRLQKVVGAISDSDSVHGNPDLQNLVS